MAVVCVHAAGSDSQAAGLRFHAGLHQGLTGAPGACGWLPNALTLSSPPLQKLCISIPWTGLLTKPIEVTLSRLECILTATAPDNATQQPAPGTGDGSGSHRSPTKPPRGRYVDDVHSIWRVGVGWMLTTRLHGRSVRGKSASGDEVEASSLPSWLQSRLTQIMANITLKIDNLVVKYVHSNVVVSIGVRVRSTASACQLHASDCDRVYSTWK